MRSLTAAAIVLLLSASHTVAGVRPQAPTRDRHAAAVPMQEIEALPANIAAISAVNNRGDIVGSFRGTPFRWTEKDGLELLLPGIGGTARDVNDRGDVVGTYQAPGLDETTAGFLWTRKAGFLDLGTFWPAAINNRGVMAGLCVEAEGSHPCVWEDGRVTKLGEEWPYGSALDINERGQVVGQVLLSGFVWTPGAGIVLLPGSAQGPDVVTYGGAINNGGDVVGSQYNHPSTSPMRWSEWGEVGAIAPFEHDAVLVGINDGGWSIGRYGVEVEPGHFVWEAFLLSPAGEITDLGRGYPIAITNDGRIIGVSEAGEPRTVIWRR